MVCQGDYNPVERAGEGECTSLVRRIDLGACAHTNIERLSQYLPSMEVLSGQYEIPGIDRTTESDGHLP